MAGVESFGNYIVNADLTFWISPLYGTIANFFGGLIFLPLASGTVDLFVRAFRTAPVESVKGKSHLWLFTLVALAGTIFITLVLWITAAIGAIALGSP
ncbi:MAG TPA: hypothetical protein VFF30_03435 [Nitrososphaerales archaeon]|nr:hypothetical protein [Nitrososphaerales archaeon]